VTVTVFGTILTGWGRATAYVHDKPQHTAPLLGGGRQGYHW